MEDTYERFRNNPLLFITNALHGYTIDLSREQLEAIIIELSDHSKEGATGN